MRLPPKQQAEAIFNIVLSEFPVRTWLETVAVNGAREKLRELSEEQCQRIISKAKAILNGQ